MTVKFALVAPDGTVNRIEDNVDPTVLVKADWSWRPYVEQPRPLMDDAVTSVVETITVEPTQVVQSWATVRRAPTPKDVGLECERRLGLGFNYDFGDARGVHRIGTTRADMTGWNEVTTVCAALMALGLGSQTIAIVTDTGAANVTAAEWQSILIAAAGFRQPIWTGSFALQEMSPIPDDYATNEAYWA